MNKQFEVYVTTDHPYINNLIPLTKSAAYKMKLDAMKRQGYRSDLHANLTSTTILKSLC